MGPATHQDLPGSDAEATIGVEGDGFLRFAVRGLRGALARAPPARRGEAVGAARARPRRRDRARELRHRRVADLRRGRRAELRGPPAATAARL